MEDESAAPDTLANPALGCIERYQRAYLVANVAWMVGLVLFVLALLMLALSAYSCFTQRSLHSQELMAFLGIPRPPFLLVLATAALKGGLPPFLAGLLAIVLASLLRCCTDAVVQSSPFLNQEQRALLMGLK